MCYKECNGSYIPKEQECTVETDCSTIDATNAEKCGYKECNGSYIPKEQECTVGPECDNPQTDQEYRDCGYLQCGPNTENEGQWFPEDTDMEQACGSVIIVDEFCQDPNSTTYGQAGECGPCKDTFEKKDGICQCPEGTREEQGRCVSDPTGNPCVDEDGYAESNPIECGWKHCGGNVYVSPEKDCPITVDPCVDEPGYDKDHPRECGWTDCGDGTFVPPEEECGPPTTKCEDEDAINYLEDGPCIFGPGLEKCEDEDAINYLEDGPCTYSPYTCPDPNATTNEDGSCGPCKTGYVYDGALERCVQTTVVDPCLDSAYAEANPTICGTDPECNDCTCAEYAADNPDECGTTPPPPPPPPSGGGADGSTFGSGMFDMTPTDITAAPELLAAANFPIVDFLSDALPKNVKSNVMKGLFEGLV